MVPMQRLIFVDALVLSSVFSSACPQFRTAHISFPWYPKCQQEQAHGALVLFLILTRVSAWPAASSSDLSLMLTVWVRSRVFFLFVRIFDVSNLILKYSITSNIIISLKQNCQNPYKMKSIFLFGVLIIFLPNVPVNPHHHQEQKIYFHLINFSLWGYILLNYDNM